MAEPIERSIRLKRLKIRAWRRGMKEMDLILGGYVDRHSETLSDTDIGHLETLMERPDQSLFAWVSGATPAPADASADEKALVEKLYAFRA